MQPAFFASAARELLAGFYRKELGRGITYAEALDEALSFGWIDGVRKRFNAEATSVGGKRKGRELLAGSGEQVVSPCGLTPRGRSSRSRIRGCHRRSARGRSRNASRRRKGAAGRKPPCR